MDRTDDPLLNADEVAALLGISRSAWVNYVQRRQPASNPAPEPEPGDVDLDRGHARPRWRRSRVLAWHAARPGSPGRPRDAG